MGRVQVEELEKHGVYLSVPKGSSMKPMLRSLEDVCEVHRLDGMAKRYDVVMYVRPNGQGVIHRVMHVRAEEYIILGDNCWQLEHVPHDWVKGIVRRFYRGGKWHAVTEPLYLLYAHVWSDLIFLKCPVLFARDMAKRVCRRIKGNKR